MVSLLNKKVIIYLSFVAVLTFVLIFNLLGVTKNNGAGMGVNKGKCFVVPKSIQNINAECTNLGDEGIDVFKLGGVDYLAEGEAKETLNESCTKEGNLIEYDCSQGKVSIYVVDCLNGCENGVCKTCN